VSVRASAGGFIGSAIVTVVPPPNEAPVAAISAPSAGSSFTRGRSVEFFGAGTDPEDGAIPADRLEWFVDGTLAGTGTQFTTPDLSVGDRQIRLVASDSSGATGADSTSITVVAPVGSDTSAPTLAALALSKDTLTIGSQPDTVVVTVRLTEDLSGVRIVQVQLISTTTSQVLGWTQLWRSDGDYYDGTFDAPIVFGQNAATGAWNLRIQTTDHAGNTLALIWTELANRGLPSVVFVR